MGNRRLFSLIVIGMVLSAAPAGLAAQDSAIVTDDTIVSREIARRQELLQDYNRLMQTARDLCEKGEYDKADEIYQKQIPPIFDQLGLDFTVAQQQELALAYDELNYAWARFEADAAELLIGQGRYRDAIFRLQNANERYPSQVYTDRIAFCNSREKAINYERETSLEYNDPAGEERQNRINTLLGQAKVCYDDGKYQLARDLCEQAYIYDPYNVTAAYYLDKIYRKVATAAEARREADNVLRLSQVQWRWISAIPFDNGSVVVSPPPTMETGGLRTDMYDKLNKIILPNVDFEGVSVRDVINALNEESKLNDPMKKGVTIHSNILAADADNYPKVSLQAIDMPLGEVIRYVCLKTNLKYQVRATEVFIAKEVSDMEQAQFKVLTSVYQRILQNAPEGESDGGATEAPDGLGGLLPGLTGGRGTREADDTRKLRAYFSQRGVSFPDGASISYSTRTGRMTVHNTPDNIQRVGTLIDAIGDELPLVLIESKFLEVMQQHLEQLGFHWALTKSYGTAADPNNPKTGELVPGKMMTSFSMPDDILYAAGDVDENGYNPAAIFSTVLMPNAGPDDNINLKFSITALDQKDITESLASPRVLTTSGQEAVLRMVRQEWYPTTWTEPEISSTSVGVTLEPAIPEFDGATDIGITLRVTPRVAPNKHTIELELAPRVSEFESWEEYFYYVSVPGSAYPVEQVIKMPRITYREFEAKLRVDNGETVILGGVLKDETSVYDYKYPFLGDLPLVGRLFRDYKKVSAKTNLLIFITARIMRNDGTPSEPATNTGLHDYRR